MTFRFLRSLIVVGALTSACGGGPDSPTSGSSGDAGGGSAGSSGSSGSSGTSGSSGDPGSSSGKPTGAASCTVTVSGGLTGTNPCSARIYAKERDVRIRVDGKFSQSSELNGFNFFVGLAKENAFAVREYSVATIYPASGSATGRSSDASWYANGQIGTPSTTNPFVVDITSIGTKDDIAFPGSAGTLDVTLTDLAGTRPAVKAHVEFVSETCADAPDFPCP